MDYQAVTEEAQKENKTVQTFETEDGEGNVVKVAACSDDLYVTARSAPVYATPGETGEILAELILGEQVSRSAVCDNSWSKISIEKEGKKLIGYLRTQYLSDDIQIEPVEDEAEVKADSSILDYPGRKDGEIVGEVLEFDKVKRTGTVNDVWSRILYQDEKGEEKTGYIPTSVLDLPEAVKTADAGIDKEMDAGTLHKSSGTGVFAEALEAGVTVNEENGVLIGSSCGRVFRRQPKASWEIQD